MIVPHGLEEIKAAYGDPYPLIQDDGTIAADWERSILDFLVLPAPLALGWAPDILVNRIRCHKFILDSLGEVLSSIYDDGLWGDFDSFDGCYCWRAKRGQEKLSTHSWAIAVDFNASTNAFRSRGDMPEEIIEAFERRQWIWGGRWPRRFCDPMHFQFCSGY